MKPNTIIILISISTCLLTILGCKYYIHKTFNTVSLIITTYISKRTIGMEIFKDTREAKLISQVKQLVRITDHKANTFREEKEAVTTLISDLSHQLKTPLANISIYTELLNDSSLTEEEKMEFIIRTNEQAKKMEWLIQALLKTSRLETGIIEFTVSPSYMKETIADGISSVCGQADNKGIQIITEDFEDQRVLHNQKWTAEAISNILENAIKYSPRNSVIEIRIEPREIYTVIQITDQGIGIGSEEYNLIFKRFYRSKQVEQKVGTGLGLYLSQLILSKEGGYITVNSTIGKGSCFSLFLQKGIN